MTALPAYAPARLPAPRPPRRPFLPGPTPLPATSLPGRRHLTRLVTALVESMAGRRPGRQLAPVMTYSTQTALRVLPRQPRDLRLHSVRICQVDRRTAEIAATLVTARRAKALAVRVEHNGQTWQVTALHVIGG